MSVAPDERSLKQRLDRYVWHNASTEAVLLRSLLKEHFGSFARVGIIGGMVRDFARGGRAAFKSDVDLVIEGEPARVDEMARGISAKANRFGGYGFRVGPWNIDFWALERTWAATHGHVAVRELADVTGCVFFDWDAIVYDIGSRRVLCDPRYLDRLRSGRMEISLRSNPGEIGNLLRAARRLIRWGLEPGPELRRFIDEKLDETTFATMRALERRKHPDRVLDDHVSAAELRHALLNGACPKTASLRQMSLAFTEPERIAT